MYGTTPGALRSHARMRMYLTGGGSDEDRNVSCTVNLCFHSVAVARVFVLDRGVANGEFLLSVVVGVYASCTSPVVYMFCILSIPCNTQRVQYSTTTATTHTPS